VYEDKLIKFRKSSAFGSGSVMFSWIHRHYEGRFSFVIWLIPLEKLIGSSWKCYHRCIYGYASALFILEVTRIRASDSPWRRRGMHSPCALVHASYP